MNEGTMDRGIRVLAGIILGVVSWVALGVQDGTIPGIIVGVIALVLLLTGICGRCPAYSVLGIRTCPVSPKKNHSDQAAS